MRKQPMTTEELFLQINGILKENGHLPDILDYRLDIPAKMYRYSGKVDIFEE